MRGETRRKARRRIRRRSIAARIAAKTTGEAAQGAGERPSPRAPRRTPEGAKRGFVSGRSRAEPFWARRIRQDRGPTAYMYTPSGRVDGEAARSERRARLPETKPHIDRQTSTAQAKLASPKPKHAPPRPRHRHQVAYFATLSTRSATFEAASGVARARIFADISARRSGRS